MRVLADTSVWVDCWRRGNDALGRLADADRLVIHPFVIGELTLGDLRPRDTVLADLHALDTTRVAEHEEVLGLIERRRLWRRGLGWVDAHLLAAALLDGVGLWTLDAALARAAAALGIAWDHDRPH